MSAVRPPRTISGIYGWIPNLAVCDAEPIMSDAAGRGGARIAESLAASMLLQVPVLTDALVHTIREQNLGYRTVNVVPMDDLWRSCHDNITRVLQLLAGSHRDKDAPEDDGYYDAARETGRRRAEQRMPLDDVLRSFRLGGRLVWEALIDQAREQSAVDNAGLLDVATRVWEVVDATSAQVALAYHAAERQLVRFDEQRKAALWEGLLRGRAKDLAFAYEAARILDLPVEGPYAVVAADDRAGDDGTTVLLSERLAACGIGSAWQVRASTLVGLLALGESALGTALGILRETLDAPAGVSSVVHGLAEADVAYRQATLTRRTLHPRRFEVVTLEERLPEALLLGSPELAERLVRLWLGPLQDLPADDRRLLLDTLETWVSTAGSTTRTAEAVHCHRNTVINRIRRIQTITGRDFAAGTTPVELLLALRAARLLMPGPLA
ncbi:MAG TPA: helix-turn-helix domain-containing protein [Actinomadura sp.]|nr:helix-turn-helix domain-containing protein [Actinomadura sp.]